MIYEVKIFFVVFKKLKKCWYEILVRNKLFNKKVYYELSWFNQLHLLQTFPNISLLV